MTRLVAKRESVDSPRHCYVVQCGYFKTLMAGGWHKQFGGYDVRVIPLGHGYEEAVYIFEAETLVACLDEFPETVKAVKHGCFDPEWYE